MGAKQGRTKGNKQKAEYLESDGKHGKLGWKEEEERKTERKAVKLVEPTVRRKQWKKEKKKQKLSS